MEGGSQYCFVCSITAVMLIIGIGRHKQRCQDSATYAEKTSLGTLFIMCTTDLSITIINISFLVSNPVWFDYMMIG
jgi:hypothetical protein